MQSAYATLATGSSRVRGVEEQHQRLAGDQERHTYSQDGGCKLDLINAISAKGPDTLTLDKLDLSGLDEWPTEQAEKARGLLKEYHDIFFLEKQDMGHTKAAEHKIVLKDPDTPPFKERFRRIPPPQLDEVREHLKLMLDAGVIRPSNSHGAMLLSW